MRRSPALDVAMSLVDQPAAVRDARSVRLPGGIGLLLQVAAGDQGALSSAQAMTGRPPAVLQGAAGFFIEQILFDPQADYYRVLGASAGAPRSQLRQHMALLIKWLHPDGREHRVSWSDLDRGIFIHRVTHAWEHLKSDDRRAAYDRALSEKTKEKTPRRSRRSRGTGRIRRPERRRASADQPDRKGSFRRLIMVHLERQGLLNRVLTYFWMRG